jgi:hypothetical protein
MDVFVAITLLTAMVILAMTRARRRHRANRIDQVNRIDQAPPTSRVLLSVLPDRTALVTVDVKCDASSPAVAELVNEAVRHAFTLASVDNVEVRRSDGELLGRPGRQDGAALSRIGRPGEPSA